MREFGGDVDGGEEEVKRRVDASGGAVGGVECGVHIPGDEDCVICFQRFVNSSEDVVGLEVPAPPSPPTLNDAVVVAIDFDSEEATRFENRLDEEFHGDGFSPADVSSVEVPTRAKTPGSPPVANDNAEASS